MTKRVLTMQDISCLGQCSLTVALPIISACGIETVILPSAVLSTHTGGSFENYTFHDLTDDIPGVWMHKDFSSVSLFYEIFINGQSVYNKTVSLTRNRRAFGLTVCTQVIWETYGRSIW